MKDNAHRRMESLKNWILPFSEAWDMLMEIPFPGSAGRRGGEQQAEPALVLFNFPVVATLISFAALVIAALFSYIMAKPVFAVAFAIFFTVLLEFLTRCKSLSVAASFFENRFSGLSSYESFLDLNEDLNAQRGPVGTIALLVIFLFRMFCVGMLTYHGQVFWVLPALVAGYAVQAHLAVVENVKDSTQFIEANDGDVIKMWVITSIIILLFSFCFKSVSAPVLLLILSFLGASLFRKYCVEILDGVTGNVISFAGYLTETIMFLLGVLLLVRN